MHVYCKIAKFDEKWLFKGIKHHVEEVPLRNDRTVPAKNEKVTDEQIGIIGEAGGDIYGFFLE